MLLGEKIAAVRKKQGITQEQLAERLNVSRQTISKWELHLAYPELTTFIQLAELLQVSTDELLLDRKPERLKIADSANDFYIDWTEVYPILKNYEADIDIVRYRNKLILIIDDMMKRYQLNAEDVFLILKDLLYKEYQQRKKQ